MRVDEVMTQADELAGSSVPLIRSPASYGRIPS
jgi:hypothetical protein